MIPIHIRLTLDRAITRTHIPERPAIIPSTLAPGPACPHPQ